MTQTSTDLYQKYGLPGHFTCHPRETESMVVPYIPQVTTITFADDPIVNGDYVFAFPIYSGYTVTVTVTAAGAPAVGDFMVDVAAAFAANPALSHLATPAAGATTTTLTYRDSANTFAVPTLTVPGGATVSAAVSTPSGGTALEMGKFYAYGTQPTGKGGVSPTTRAARVARAIGGSDTLATVRGVVGREVNSTTLAADFDDTATYDQYLPGAIFPGINRHDVIARIDPASGAMGLTSNVFLVLAAGTYSQVGTIADAADGGNTLQLNSGNDPLARVVTQENTIAINGQSVRVCAIKLNRTS